MNKTININLGGLSFFIDEDAYQKMTRYFSAIKRSLNNSNGQDEIIKDIEMRIAELISEKHSSDKQVISMAELDQVIAVMGQPEDYRLDNEESESSSNTQNFNNNRIGHKKLYRDRENGMIGGVLAGLGFYFGVEKVWLRLALVLLLIFYGTGFLIYIILWIVVPEAITTSEKLEMRGEPVNLSNIEKQVRDGIDTVSDKIKNADYDKFSSNVGRVGSSFGDFIVVILGLFAKFIGVILILCGVSVIVTLIIGLLAVNSIIVFDGIPWTTMLYSGGFSDYSVWFIGFLLLLSIGIPFFGLILVGVRMVIPSTQSIGNIAKYSLTAVSILATVLLFVIGMQFASSFSTQGRIIEKTNLIFNPKDTLKIKFIHSDFYAKSIDDESFEITEDSLKRQVIYNNNVQLEIVENEGSKAYVQIEKQARGKSLTDARSIAEKIEYKFKMQGNNIIFDNYLIADLKSKFRNQRVVIKLFLPKGTIFKADKSVQEYDESDNDYFNLHFSSDDYTYKVEKNQIKCLDCPTDEDGYNDVGYESDEQLDRSIDDDSSKVKTVSVKINGKEIIKSETNSKTTKLEINEDGIITKTK